MCYTGIMCRPVVIRCPSTEQAVPSTCAHSIVKTRRPRKAINGAKQLMPHSIRRKHPRPRPVSALAHSAGDRRSPGWYPGDLLGGARGRRQENGRPKAVRGDGPRGDFPGQAGDLQLSPYGSRARANRPGADSGHLAGRVPVGGWNARPILHQHFHRVHTCSLGTGTPSKESVFTMLSVILTVS